MEPLYSSPMPETPTESTSNLAFDDLSMNPALKRNLVELGFTRMTLVQEKALPHVLAGKDVLARAKTGSGKTAAFGLGLINQLDVRRLEVQALVLCPTRELADQVAKELRRLARTVANVKVLTLCGGTPFGPQVGSLKHGTHVVVGTPGRVLKHLNKRLLKLSKLKVLVLDEADRMMDMGFEDEIDAILSLVPDKRQTLLFSATYPDAIAGISARVQKNPVHIDVTEQEQPAAIEQHWYAVSAENRKQELLRALTQWGGSLNLVFCNTKIDCAELAAYLQDNDIDTVALHGDLEQMERNQALVRFGNKSTRILIATDVAARGLDIKDIDAVLNYELPTQADVYIHRIGRTGRAGQKGIAISLVTQREMSRLNAIQQILPEATLVCSTWPEDTGPDTGSKERLKPRMTTIEVNAGRKGKLRAGDLLGALTAGQKISGESVGKIDIFENKSFIAVSSKLAQQALNQLNEGKIKNRRFRARILRG